MAFHTERRKLTICYLVAQSLYVVYHVALLASSAVYRWTLIVWPFFAVNVAASLILCIATLVLAVICRINFGRGLDHFRASFFFLLAFSIILMSLQFM